MKARENMSCVKADSMQPSILSIEPRTAVPCPGVCEASFLGMDKDISKGGKPLGGWG